MDDMETTQSSKKATDTSGALLHLGVTLYSFNAEYYQYKLSFQDCLEKVGSLGSGTGVELVGPQMVDSWPEVSEEFEKTFKNLVERYELTPTAYGGYQDWRRFGRVLTLEENVEHCRLQIRSAKRLGFPILRLMLYPEQMTGSSRTNILAYAEKMGVKIGHEIHAPNSFRDPLLRQLIELAQKLNTPYFGFVPDCGIFSKACAQPYLKKFEQMGVPAVIRERIVELWKKQTPWPEVAAEIKAMGGDNMAHLMVVESFIYFGHEDPKSLYEIMPHIFHVHGKFFGIDPATGEEPACRYPEVIAALKNGGFSGYISTEYEGHHWVPDGDALWQIRAHHAMVRKFLAQA
jgi:sugar phosphate isomerase/epimerase